MNVLGINVSQHDSGAALVQDGKLRCAAQQERFDRVKHSGNKPVSAIRFCMDYASLKWSDIDMISIPWWNLDYNEVLYMIKAMEDDNQNCTGIIEEFEQCVEKLKKYDKNKKFICNGKKKALEHPNLYDLSFLKEMIGNNKIPIKYYDHNHCHAKAAYFFSPFEESDVLVIDGRGELSSIGYYEGKGNELSYRTGESYKNSLGEFYQYISSNYLALGSYSEGKTMGLASYGENSEIYDILKKVLDLDKDKWFRLNLDNLEYLKFGKRQRYQSPMDENYRNLAYATQRCLEDAVFKILDTEMKGKRNLCLGGGTFLNSTMNGKILRSGKVKDVFIYPAASDEGIAAGAALCACKEIKRNPMTHAYYGPVYDIFQTLEELRSNFKIDHTRSENIAKDTAKLLAENKIGAWFQGRMELGPRALGNRSIISNPTDAKTLDRVNKIKFRSEWRPLAPTILSEKAGEYFEDISDSPYMLMTFIVKPDKWAKIPAIVHVDGSARPQTLKRETNPKFYALIEEFEKLTGIPIVMNTSFNLSDEPIVCSVRDAIKTFLRSELDFLVIGDYIIKKN